jgi:cGMP-dependent protein kinase
MCILTEMITGGDLHAAIRTIPRELNRSEAQFYVGSILIALGVLSDRNIVYRDLKPENVLLDAQGYVKIIDFGICKKLGGGPGSRTFTKVGTPHYMAPEVIRGQGHGVEADLWSLGVMAFELVCSFLPFANHSDDPDEVCNAVLRDTLIFPLRCRDSDCHALVSGLLTRDPTCRLGAGAGGLANVRSHRFFSVEGEAPEALFDRIQGRKLKPPYVPNAETSCEDDDVFSDKEDLWPVSVPAIATGDSIAGRARAVSCGPARTKANHECLHGSKCLPGLPGLPTLSQSGLYGETCGYKNPLSTPPLAPLS